jgi:hypothetical protein
LLIKNLGTEVEANASPIVDIVSAGLVPADAQGIQTVLRGKSGSRLADSIAGDPKDADPIQEGRQVASEWHGSVKSLIGACVRIRRVILTWKNDKARIEAFLRALVAGHVLSRAEARLGLAAPKLCKLVKIGQGADLLQRSQIAPFLMPSYTTLYQLIVLYEALPDGEGGQKTAALVRILSACPGEVSREYLIEATRRLKLARNMAKAVNGIPERPSTDTKPFDLMEAGEQFDLLLLTPRKNDLRSLRADYGDGFTLERCLPLLNRIERSAAVVITARITDLPLIENVLLPLTGFPSLSHVLLLLRPTSPDLTQSEVLITAERGQMQLTSEECAWSDGLGSIDASAIAARLYPDASRRLHVFAPKQVDGWHCLVGDDSWAEMPSVR